MSYVAVNEDGVEKVWTYKPERYHDIWTNWDDSELENVELPKGSIEKLIGKKLTWKDEFVELKATK